MGQADRRFAGCHGIVKRRKILDIRFWRGDRSTLGENEEREGIKEKSKKRKAGKI